MQPCTRQSALPPSAGRRGEARRGRSSQVRIAPFGRSESSSAHSSGSTRRGDGASPAASPQAQRSPSTPGRGAWRHPLAPRTPTSGAPAPTRCSPIPPPTAGPAAESRPLPCPGPGLPSPTPAPGPGSRRPACAPGALMSSRDSPRGLTWCLVRISRQDLSSRGSIRQAHLPAAAPRGGAGCRGRH